MKKGFLIRQSADFIAQKLQARRGWHDISKVLTGKSLQPRLFYPAKLSCRIETDIKNFSDKQKLIEFKDTKCALKEIFEVYSPNFPGLEMFWPSDTSYIFP